MFIVKYGRNSICHSLVSEEFRRKIWKPSYSTTEIECLVSMVRKSFK